MSRQTDPEERKLNASRQALKNATADLFQGWADLESALAMLFATALATPGMGQAAFAVYFAPNNMETRIKLVDVAVTGALKMPPHSDRLLAAWTTTLNAIGRLKNVRNSVAHGCHVLTGDPGPMQWRIGPPRFHFAPMLKAMEKGTPFALSAHDISNSARAVWGHGDRVLAISAGLQALREGRDDTLQRTLAELEGDHSKENPAPNGRKFPKRKAPPRSSTE